MCLSSIDWDFNWQGHQEIMAALAEAGNDVLFVENTGVRSPAVRDLSRLRHRLSNWGRGRYGLRDERKRLVVYSPLVFPFPYSDICRRINVELLTRTFATWTHRTGRSRPVLWTFLPTPLTAYLISALQPELTIYYCTDDLSSSSPGASRLRHSETELLRTADLVFVTSDTLRARAAQVRDQVHVFPFGVKYADFEDVRSSSVALPDDLLALHRPIVGYLGGLNQKVDQALLGEVVRGLPEVQFVLIGPVESPVARTLRGSNVHILGPRRHQDVPRYLKGLSAGIIPYRLTEYTSHVYPAKLSEYLAMGLPVVSTALPEVRRFNRIHGDLVAVADDAGAFRVALRNALDESCPAAVQRRLQAAYQNRWELRIERMSALIAHALEERRRSVQ